MKERASKRIRWLKLLVAVGVISVLAWFWASGGSRFVQDPQALAALIERGGWRSVMFFGCLFVVGGSLVVPPAFFVITAGLLWPFTVALEISFVAGMMAASMGFLFSRYAARDICAAHIPKRLRQINESLHARGIKAVVVLRLLFYLFPPVNWILGLSRIRFRDYLIGSMLGSLPGTVLYVLVGAAGIPWLLSRSPATIAWIAAGTALLVLLWRAGGSMWPAGEQEPHELDHTGRVSQTSIPANEPLPEEVSPVSFSRFVRAVWTFLRLAVRTFLPPAPYRYSPSVKRLSLMIVFLPLFAAIQTVHWVALLLDEVLFPAYRKVRPKGTVFVVGVPRSGTTFLHRVLAQDTERFTTFKLWELLFAPAICERRVLLGAARIDCLLGRPAERLISWVTSRLMKKAAAVHRLSLRDAEEDFLVLLPILACFLLVVPFPYAPEIQNLARFDESFSDAERRDVMSFYYAMVQRHLHVHGSKRVFLSKNVSFTPMLQSLLKTFPCARIVACTRAPQQAVPSQISAMKGSWQLFGNPFAPDLFEKRWLDLLEHYYAHLADVLPEIPERQRVLFEMNELRTNLVKCIERLYDRFAFVPSEPYVSIVSEEAEAARSYHSHHCYTLQQYGLNENFIRRRYATVYATLNAFRGE